MRRSAKDTFLHFEPTARSERQRGNDGKAYWLIRIGDRTMPFAEGDTEAQAWKQALMRLGKGLVSE